MSTGNAIQQAPVRNPSVVGAHVYSHSGDFSPLVTDLVLRGRGVLFQFNRKYRSACSQDMDALGRGWTFTYAQQMESDGSDIIYHDGLGRLHRFTPIPRTNDYGPPNGFYAVLTDDNGTLVLRPRYGTVFTF